MPGNDYSVSSGTLKRWPVKEAWKQSCIHKQEYAKYYTDLLYGVIGLPFVTIVIELCEDDVDRFIMAVPTDDPPIGEGTVVFGSFGDLVVLSKKRIA